jgi:hypothetical protein
MNNKVLSMTPVILPLALGFATAQSVFVDYGGYHGSATRQDLAFHENLTIRVYILSIR